MMPIHSQKYITIESIARLFKSHPYSGNRVFSGDTIIYSRFAGGYFDHDGAVHYNIIDYQGSVTMVIDSLRVVKQHNGYYPYGEPWREPGGQPFLYSDKERNRLFNLNDYDFHARRLTPATALWNAPDPLAGKYPNINPYTYCASNPVMYVDPSGLAWKPTIDEITNVCTGYEWIPEEYSYENGTLKDGLYRQAIFFSNEGNKGTFDENSSYNMGTSVATVYLADGSMETFDACTHPSDKEKYATIPEGMYEAKVGTHKNYRALRVGDIGTKNFYNNTIDLGSPNPSDRSRTTAVGINIHKPGNGNLTGMTRDYKAISEGCLLIDRNSWNTFMDCFESTSIISVTVSRSMSNPINKNITKIIRFVPQTNPINTIPQILQQR